MHPVECFKIRLLTGKADNTWDVKQFSTLLEIPFQHHPLSFNPIVIVADPFLFTYKERLYLFYEEKRNYSNGVLRMISTTNLKTWTKPVTVLQVEGCHLSYPFVFEENGAVYMIPESSDLGDIRLYKADDESLSSFSLYKTLVSKEVISSEVGYADSSLFKKDGTYYLMSSIESVEGEHKNYLFLFTADQLEGPYTMHPQSPLCISMKYGRNAGCLLEYNGHLYRVAQDCEVRYGDNVHLFQIDEMNSHSYQEHLVRENLIPTEIPFYQYGGHQYNFVDFNGQRIVATDAKEYHSFWPYRLLHKSLLRVRQLFK